MNQIKTKRILFLDPTLKKVDPNPTSHGSQQLRAFIFGKYFPKYLKNFDLQTKNGSIEAKVKRTKIFRNCQGSRSPPSSRTPKLRILLGNKAKLIKNLSGDSKSLLQLTEKIKLFANLRSVQLSLNLPSRFSRFDDPYKIEKRHLRKALTTIKRFKNVKSLELNQLSNNSAHLIQTINASSVVLSSLKTLVISPGGAGDGYGSVLGFLKDSKNLLKYVTSLHLPVLRSPLHLESFHSLKNSCPNLTSLSFELSCYEIFYNSRKADRYSVECFPVGINYLSALNTFHNLKSLELHIADTFTFLNDFIPPPSLQSLLLNFKESLTKEVLTRIDQTFNNQNKNQALEFFETNQTLVNFYSNFEHLHNLQALEMLCSSHVRSEEYQYCIYLSQGILQSLPSPKLKRLHFAEGGFHWGLNPLSKSPLEDQCLLEPLQSCHTFRQTLQTLEIGHSGVILSNFNFLSFIKSFPNLSAFIFTGTFDRNDDSNNEIGLFLEEVMASGTSLVLIKLNTFVHMTGQSLFSLLRQLGQLEKPKNLKIKLQIKFYDETNLNVLEATRFEHFRRVLLDNQQEYSKLKGVDLNVFMNPVNHEKEFLKAYGEKFDNFKILPPSHNFRDFD